MALELFGLALLLAAVPALTVAVAKALLFAGYLQAGMWRTDFYYFQSALYAPFNVLLFAVVLLLIAATFLFLVSRRRDHVRAMAGTCYVSSVLLIALLLVTGYRLNRSVWFPDPSSLHRFVFCNAMVVAAFAAAGVLTLRRFARIGALGGFLLTIAAVVATSAFGHAFRSSTPVSFTEVGEEVGLVEENNSLGVGWGDFNDDGWIDVYVSNHLPIASESYLYENRRGVFLPARTMASGDMHGVAWGDFDNDGGLDAFVAGGNNTPLGPAYPNLLFHGGKGKLTDVALLAGVQDTAGRAWGGAWADFNNDGLLDLFVVNYFTSNALFRNMGNGSFTNVAQAAGVSPTAPGEVNLIGSLCASWADYDNDGDMDIVSVGIQSGISLYRNNGDGTFTDVARESGLVVKGYLGTEQDPRGPGGCSWGDYDNDGDLDLYVTSRAGDAGANLLFQNQGNGTFIEVGAAAGVASHTESEAAVWGDFDNDGYLDLYVINGASDSTDAGVPDAKGWNTLFRNKGDGTFVALPLDATGAAGFPFIRDSTGATVDFDNDGSLDIYVNNQRPLNGHPHYLMRNLLLRNSGNDNNWLEIRLRGTTSNRDGVGARVTVKTGDRSQFRQRGVESHTYAQSSPILHFGLGKAGLVDQLSIVWPSGITQSLTHVQTDRILTITEPAK